ncbi:MAG: hypothetical protein SNJ82_07670 [Gemmataceae bacterium]
MLLTSGSLSVGQSVITLLKRNFRAGSGLASAAMFYDADAARVVGEQVRRGSALDREALEHDQLTFNIQILLGGQIRGEPLQLCLIFYPQGNRF